MSSQPKPWEEWYCPTDSPIKTITRQYELALRNYEMFTVIWEGSDRGINSECWRQDIFTARTAIHNLGFPVAESMEKRGIDSTPIIGMNVASGGGGFGNRDEIFRLIPESLAAIYLLESRLDLPPTGERLRVNPTEPETKNAAIKDRAEPATVNERMAAMVQADPSLASWTARKWAERLGVSAGAVKQTHTWRVVVKGMRAHSQAERATRR